MEHSDAHDSAREPPQASHWSRYWATGQVHSCPNAFPGNYSDELRALWESFFRSLGHRARVLDVGTGNGAIAFIALETSRARRAHFEIHAIDAAQIEPARAAQALGIDPGDIRFRGSVRLEATGLPAASFDAITGQFALEYAPLPAAAAEVRRLLKPGGAALFVLHHAASPAIAAARADLAHLEALTGELPLLQAARRFLERVRTTRTAAELKAAVDEHGASAELAEVTSIGRRVRERAAQESAAAWLAGIAAQVGFALQDVARLDHAAAAARLEALEREMHAHRQRLVDILRCAQSAADITATCETLARAGLEVHEPQTLTIRGNDLIGWVLRLTQPAGSP